MNSASAISADCQSPDGPLECVSPYLDLPLTNRDAGQGPGGVKMQKNIFSDLMPMHRAYTAEGLPALAEMQRAGLFGAETMNAWRDVASDDPERVAQGNAALLQREQSVLVKQQWDVVRSYKGDVGEAVTYLITLVGSPTVAGVVQPRSYRSIQVTTKPLIGPAARVTVPLPSWNWSVHEERWDYILDELLPNYRDLVENHWPELQAQLEVAHEVQTTLHRPVLNIPQILLSAAQSFKVEYA